MIDDFDEDTLETLYDQSEVIGPIAEMRRKKEIQENTFIISRENYESSTNEQIEAWFTKFDQVIIDDSKNPYKDPLTKKEIIFKIIDRISIKNLNKGIDKFNSGINQFSQVIASSNTGKKSRMGVGVSQREYNEIFGMPKKRKGNTINFWNEDKKTRKKRNKRKPVQKNNISLYSSKKVKFF